MLRFRDAMALVVLKGKYTITEYARDGRAGGSGEDVTACMQEI